MAGIHSISISTYYICPLLLWVNFFCCWWEISKTSEGLWDLNYKETFQEEDFVRIYINTDVDIHCGACNTQAHTDNRWSFWVNSIWIWIICRLLEGLGASKNTNIFWAGGEPLGGEVALKPLVEKFGRLYNKETLALPGELDPFLGKTSTLAAIDYLISLHSDVFMPSHGGNMARALQVYFRRIISFIRIVSF